MTAPHEASAFADFFTSDFFRAVLMFLATYFGSHQGTKSANGNGNGFGH